MARRLGWLVTLALVASLAAVLAAPQIVFAINWAAGEWLPPDVLQPLRHAGFEAGLWGSGLATWLVARRIGWADGRAFAVGLVASPVIVETVAMLILGRVSGGWATWTGLLARTGVGAAALAVALWSTTWARGDARSPSP